MYKFRKKLWLSFGCGIKLETTTSPKSMSRVTWVPPRRALSCLVVTWKPEKIRKFNHHIYRIEHLNSETSVHLIAIKPSKRNLRSLNKCISMWKKTSRHFRELSTTDLEIELINNTSRYWDYHNLSLSTTDLEIEFKKTMLPFKSVFECCYCREQLSS